MKLLRNTSLLVLVCMSYFSFGAGGPKLIGINSQGGAYWGGTIIRYTGGDTVVSSHYDLPAGANPCNTLLQASDGKMYGTTLSDGPNAHGTLFQYDYATATYTVMVNFTDSTGSRAIGSLMQASDGLIYGFTALGGSNNSGTLYSYAPGSNSVTVVHELPTTSYSAPRGAPVQASNGKLYGLTMSDGTHGGGTIVEYDLSAHTYLVKYNLPAFALPIGSLIEVGADTLYGLTYGDGFHSSGTLFRYVVATGAYDTLYNFISGAPEGTLIRATDDKLYGTLPQGDSIHTGQLFSFDRYTRTFTAVVNCAAYGVDGAAPQGSLMQASDGNLYGMMSQGGPQGYGSIFKYDIATSTYTPEVFLDTIVGTFSLYGAFIEYNPTLGIAPVSTAENPVRIYGKTGAIVVERPDDSPATVMVSNLLGQELIQTTTRDMSLAIPVEISNAIYIVHVREADGETVRKVFVR